MGELCTCIFSSWMVYKQFLGFRGIFRDLFDFRNLLQRFRPLQYLVLDAFCLSPCPVSLSPCLVSLSPWPLSPCLPAPLSPCPVSLGPCLPEVGSSLSCLPVPSPFLNFSGPSESTNSLRHDKVYLKTWRGEEERGGPLVFLTWLKLLRNSVLPHLSSNVG